MIKRETYMSRIRPFIGNDLVKVLTGIRRSGKSVMLDLIKEELCASGVDSSQFISINFENMSNAHLCTAVALHDEIIRRASEIKGKVDVYKRQAPARKAGQTFRTSDNQGKLPVPTSGATSKFYLWLHDE